MPADFQKQLILRNYHKSDVISDGLVLIEQRDVNRPYGVSRKLRKKFGTEILSILPEIEISPTNKWNKIATLNSDI